MTAILQFPTLFTPEPPLPEAEYFRFAKPVKSLGFQVGDLLSICSPEDSRNLLIHVLTPDQVALIPGFISAGILRHEESE